MRNFGGYPNEYCKPMIGNSHFHEIEGITGLSDRHDHEFYARTIKTFGRGRSHYHTLEGLTSFDDGHEHLINLRTGPAVLADGLAHTHFIDGKTAINSSHRHALKEMLSL